MSSIKSIDDLRREKDDLLRGFIAAKLFKVLEEGDVLVAAVQQGLADEWLGTYDDLIGAEVKRLILDLISGSRVPDRTPAKSAPSVPVYPISPPNWPEKSTHCLAVGVLHAFGRASHKDAGFVVLAGSEFSATDDPAISNGNYKDIWLEIRTTDNLLEEVDGKFISTVDIEFSSAALAATVVRAVHGKTEDWEDARRMPLKSRGRGGSPRYTILSQPNTEPKLKTSLFANSVVSGIAMQAASPQLEFGMSETNPDRLKGSTRPGKKRSRRHR